MEVVPSHRILFQPVSASTALSNRQTGIKQSKKIKQDQTYLCSLTSTFPSCFLLDPQNDRRPKHRHFGN